MLKSISVAIVAAATLSTPLTASAAPMSAATPAGSADARYATPAHFSINPGAMHTRAAAGAFVNGSAGVTFAVPAKHAPTLYLGTVVRSNGNRAGYRGKVALSANGSMVVMISRVRHGIEKDLASTRLTRKATAGQHLRVEINATGRSRVTLRSRAWVLGTTEPGWQVGVTDGSKTRVDTAGLPRAYGYLSKAAASTVRVPFSAVNRVAGPGSVTTPAAAPVDDLSHWKPDMTEDFNTLDTARWNVKNNTSASNENSYLLGANTTVANGDLRIQGKLQSVAGHDYTSGYVDTNGKYSLPNYFRAEVRAKVPFQQGLWAAPLWFRPTTGGIGEIDLAETYGKESANPLVHQTIHTEYGATHRQAAITKPYTAIGTAAATDWHTYTIEKTPGNMTMWVDGVKTSSFTAGSPTWYNAYFETGLRWNLRVNMQIGGSYGGLPNASTNWSPDTSAMQLDYIKTWIPS